MVETVVQRYHWFWWRLWRINGWLARRTGSQRLRRLDRWIYARR